MSLQNLCAKRELFFTQYADIEKSIQTLRELCKDNNEKLVLIESFVSIWSKKVKCFLFGLFCGALSKHTI